MGRKKPYRLILALNGDERDSLGSFTTEIMGRKKLKELSDESFNNVLFPKRFITTNVIHECKYEIILIKKREESDPTVSLVKNDIGEFVEYKANNDMWMIIDKLPYYMEEEFWVYGFHPLTDRKTFSFIFNELISPLAQDKYTLLSMGVYKNKVIFESSILNYLVICKNKSDAIRLYNTIQEKILKERKYKYITCLGDCNSTKISRERIIETIHNLTNWNRQKIIRSTTKTQRK